MTALQMTRLSFAFSLVLVAACDGSSSPTAPETAGNGTTSPSQVVAPPPSPTGTNAAPQFADAGDEFAYEQLVEELPELRAALASGEVSQGGCAGNLSYAQRIASHADERVRAVSTEVTELCGRDAWLLDAETELNEAQASLAADPEARILRQCSQANFALEHVDAAFATHERVVALRERAATMCGN